MKSKADGLPVHIPFQQAARRRGRLPDRPAVGFALLLLPVLPLLATAPAGHAAEYTAREATTTPVIDGDIGEFAPAEAIHINNTNGTTGTYRLLYDEDNLYVAADVLDGNLNQAVATEEGQLWFDDSLELMLDTAHNHGTQLDNDDYKFWVTVSGVRREQRGLDASWNGRWRSAAVKAGTVNDDTDMDNGYTIELAIPWSTLGLGEPLGPDSVIGLQIGMNDLDASGATSITRWATPSGRANAPDNWGDLRSVDRAAGPAGPAFAAMFPASTILPGFACYGCAEWQAFIDSDPPFEVRYVTNLDTSGPGSFNDAVSNCPAPGTLLFIVPKVSGVIEYPADSVQPTSCDHQVFAGQYAPSPGLYWKGLEVAPKEAEKQLWMHAGCLSVSSTQPTGKCFVQFGPAVTEDIIWFNVGGVFASDGAYNIGKGARNSSVIQSMSLYPIPEPSRLNLKQIALLGQDDGSSDDLMWARNVGSHCSARGPRILEVDILVSNNVDLNCSNDWINMSAIDISGISANLIGNLFIEGVNSNSNVRPIAFDRFTSFPDEISEPISVHVEGNRAVVRDDSIEANLILDNSNGNWSDPGHVVEDARPAGYVSTGISPGLAGEEEFAALVCANAGPRPNDRIAVFQQACDEIGAAFDGGDSGRHIVSVAEHELGYPAVPENHCDPEVASDCGPGAPALPVHGTASQMMDAVWAAHCAVMPAGATGC